LKSIDDLVVFKNDPKQSVGTINSTISA
jgi:hypothetical protein